MRLAFKTSTSAALLVAFCGLLQPVALTFANEGQQVRPHTYTARVTRVFDGDTLWVSLQAGGPPRKLRLLGLDAPEICQDGGKASRDALAGHVLRQLVQVEVTRQDDYGRGLARLQLAGDDVGAWLVRQGQAWSYRWRNSLGPYAAEVAVARQTRMGLFAAVNAEIPRSFRERHGPCPRP